MIDSKTSLIGVFVLRVTVGAALLAHSLYLKIFIFTMAGTSKFFDSIGLPGFLAWVVLLLEAIAGIMILVGLKTRYAAAAVIPVLIGATWAHSQNGWLFSNTGGGWEYPMFWTMALVTLVLQGNGALSVETTTA